MNKTELITAIAESADISKKDSEKALKAFVDVVTEELKKGEKVQLVGYQLINSFERADKKALTGIIVSALLLLFLLKTEAGPDIIEGEKNAA